MADETPRYRHIVVGDPRREPFTSPGKGPKRPEIPAQDRPSHGASLRQQLRDIAAVAPVDEEPEVPGLNVEFESFPDVELAFESLSRERSGFELRNVRTVGPPTLASARPTACWRPRCETLDGNTEERRGTISVFNGPEPVIHVENTPAAEAAAAGTWMKERVAEGLKHHEIAVSVRSPAQLDRARQAVAKAGLLAHELDEHVEPGHGKVSIGTPASEFLDDLRG